VFVWSSSFSSRKRGCSKALTGLDSLVRVGTMGNAPSWVTDLFCPTIGTIICNVMWLSPLSAVLGALSKRDLGTLNPVPFVVTVANCIAWTMYGCMRRDYFIFFSNSTGLCLGLFYSLSSLTLLNKKRDIQQLLIILLVAACVFWCLMAMVACIVYSDDLASREQGIRFIGTLGMGFGLAYYSSPLSTLVQVVRNRDSSTLYLPMIVSSFLNALMWVIYGYVAKNDVALWLPNAVGCILCTMQFILRMSFPQRNVNVPENITVDTAKPLQQPSHEEKVTITVINPLQNSADGLSGRD